VSVRPPPGLGFPATEINIAKSTVGMAEWKLAERHHRVRLALAYLGESEFSGAPFTVRYKQLSRRELTVELLNSSYPAGRAQVSNQLSYCLPFPSPPALPGCLLCLLCPPVGSHPGT
jgi:hypothetical protein